MSSKWLSTDSTTAPPLNGGSGASGTASTVRVRPTPRVHRKASLNTNSTVKSTTSPAGNTASASATPLLPPSTAFVAPPVPVASPPLTVVPTSSAASSSASNTTRSGVRFHSLRKSSLTDPTASSSAKTVSGSGDNSTTNSSQHRHRSPSPSSRTASSRSDSPTRPRTPTTRITTTSTINSPPIPQVTNASSAIAVGSSVRSPSPIRPGSNSSAVKSSSPSRYAPNGVNSPPPTSAAVITSSRSRSRSRSPTKDRRAASPSSSSSSSSSSASTTTTRPRSPSPTKKPNSPPNSKAEPSVSSAAIVRSPSPTRIVMPTEKAPASPKSPSTRKSISRLTKPVVSSAEEDDEDDPTATTSVESADSDEITEETDATTPDDDNTAAENSVPNRRPVDVLNPLVEDLDFEPEESFTELERQRKRKLARLEAAEANESSQAQQPPQTANASIHPILSAVVHNNQTRTPVTTPLKQQPPLSAMKSTPLTPPMPSASDSVLKWHVPTPFNPTFLSTHYRPGEHDLYFAYGSNLNLARMRARRIEVIGGAGLSACLMNYRLVFNKTSESLGADCLKPGAIGYANILPTPNESVFGIVYIVRKTSLIPSTATSSSVILKGGLDGLDVYEGVEQQMYARQTVGVQLQDGSIVSATTYIACAEACSLTPEGLAPTQSYLNHLLAGHALLPADYHAQIEKTPLSWMPDPALAHHASHALEVSEPLTNHGQQSPLRSQGEQNGM